MGIDYAQEYERLSNEVYLNTLSFPKRGFIPTDGGVYFNEALVEASLRAARKALDAEPDLDMLRLGRAMLLQTIGRLSEAEKDATFLVAKGGEIAKPARVILKQIRLSTKSGRAD